tara:strand:+ start:129 stop:314 length:186 start_codon:yes stop_codon:yes gene_type:complete
MQRETLVEGAYAAILALADEIVAQREKIEELERLLGDARNEIAKLNRATIAGPPKSWNARK